MYIGPGQVVSLGAPPGASPTATNCGGTYVLKRMLSDLGHYVGPLDYSFGPDVDSAMLTFSLLEALPYRSGVVTEAHCTRLIARWEAKFGVAQRLKAQRGQMRRAIEEPASFASAALRCGAKGWQWDPITHTCTPPAEIKTGALPPEMEEAQACVDAGGVWHSDTQRCAYMEPPRLGWWDRQSTPMKAAVIGGGVVAAGGILYAVTR